MQIPARSASDDLAAAIQVSSSTTQLMTRLLAAAAGMPSVVAKATSSLPKLMPLLALLALVALAGGCAAAAALPVASMVSSPNASALEIHNNTNVRLQEQNFVVLKNNVVGQSSGFSLLGILTIVPASFTTAMSRLCAQAELQSGRPQTMVNLIKIASLGARGISPHPMGRGTGWGALAVANG